MLYIPWMVILGDHKIIKTSFENFVFELPRVKNCVSRLCTNPLGAPPPPPPTPPPSVGPNFSHHKARVQAVGWFPLGTRKQGSRPFAAPTPPNRNGAGPKAGPAPPPPPHALAPSHSLQAVTWGSRSLPTWTGSRRRTTSMLGSGTRMVTQQVVLLSQTSEQVDPSTTTPPPPPAPPTGGVHGVGALRAQKVEAVQGSQLDRCGYPLSGLPREPPGVRVPLQLHHRRPGQHSPVHSSSVVGDPWRPDSRPLPRGLTLLMSRVVLLGRLVLHVLERLRGWEPVHDVTVTEPNPLTS